MGLRRRMGSIVYLNFCFFPQLAVPPQSLDIVEEEDPRAVSTWTL